MGLVQRIPQGRDTISILVTTDNHVGYNENDPIRGDDAWKTFHEITKIASERNVDMVVQGGDLFHINKPSKKSMFHVIKALRLNCMGDRACELEMLSDPSMGLANGLNTVNYEDPNLNISIPVFGISGNHDDSTGDGFLSPLDLLAMSGLINHFGKVHDTENITVSPLLFQKGHTKLALYGLANVRDERLHRAFRDGLVKFQRPNIHTDEWFNLFCIHQNHVQHTYTSSIPEGFLPSFLDLVVWGHEHECVPFAVHNPETGFDVLQAGSSVATSLIEGELADKHVFVVNIRGNDYSVEPILLRTVRPLVMKHIVLSNTDIIPGAASKNDVMSYLTDEVERCIALANDKYRERNPELFGDDQDDAAARIPLPLVRLKVEYSGEYEIENARRFSNRFVGKIANINNVIDFYKKRVAADATVKKTKFVDTDVFDQEAAKASTKIQLHDLMNEFLQQAELTLLPELGINDAVQKFVENEDKYVLEQFIKREITKETELLLDIDVDDQEFHGDDERHTKAAFKQVLAQVKTKNRSVKPKTNSKSAKTNPKSAEKIVSESDSGSESGSESQKAPKAAVKSAPKPRPSRSSKAKARSQMQDVEILSGSDSDGYVEPVQKGRRTRK